jgi:molybdate transport system ATP-binding protein
MGPNGSGKSALAATLSGAGDIREGELSGRPSRCAVVSFETQAELIERERKRDDSDETDLLALGTPVREILLELAQDESELDVLVKRFGIGSLLSKGFRKLSTGETRKVLLIRALLSRPDLLILDEPFDGLDVATAASLTELLTELSQTQAMVLVLNRFDELPTFISHIAWMDKAVEGDFGGTVGHLLKTVEVAKTLEFAELKQLSHLRREDICIPEADPATKTPSLDASQDLVRMKNLRVSHSGVPLFEGLDWTIAKGQHTQVAGPNGSGKSTLLNLITGDHPQCYANDIFVFGFQRGNGETIWQIKQFIGYVSSSLQWDYRVSISARNVIISGFFDSIGVYQDCSDSQSRVADSWLALLGMSDKAADPFRQLSYGDQRLLLIARAMVKHPALLILDEPCQGLDELNRQLVLALIAKVCSQSETTVLYVNHHEEDRVTEIAHHLTLKGQASSQS